ncbi:hypothetical protein GQ53DRAFT_727357 [Thozetella sp. PMI_491]|nr:hypothetical protein GQ53DRAFT_727357 [Thozetella sp. PMI_491]
MPFPDWTTKPIPGLAISASGLIALADLSTIAQRTAIAGGSSWMDSLLLAPGLQYQQAADDLVKGDGMDAIVNAVEERDGKPVTFRVNNAATAHYIQKIARPGEVVTLDVGALPAAKARYRLKRSDSGMHATVWAEDDMPDLGWVSHVLYLMSPLLTVVVIVFQVLIKDWWALALIGLLMTSRMLNIWVIKQRSKPRPRKRRQSNQDGACGAPERTEYVVRLGGGDSSVRLRGTPDDLEAITKEAWLRAKTHVEGYLEAMAKLLVYMVAALSGNMTQLGSIITMGLLIVSAGLLALSNSNAKSFRMNGRVAAPRAPDDDSSNEAQHGTKWDPPYPHGRPGDDDKRTESWPSSSDGTGFTGMDDWAEKGQIGRAVRTSYPFDDSVDYS